ncbi:MAG: hypothetical protein U0835_20495 [Isosphaeraceae bacterium]
MSSGSQVQLRPRACSFQGFSSPSRTNAIANAAESEQSSQKDE